MEKLLHAIISKNTYKVTLWIALASIFIYSTISYLQIRNDLDKEGYEPHSLTISERINFFIKEAGFLGTHNYTWKFKGNYKINIDYPSNVSIENSSVIKVEVDSIKYDQDQSNNLELVKIKLTFGTNSFKTIPDSVIFLSFSNGASDNILIDPLGIGKKIIRIKSELQVPPIGAKFMIDSGSYKLNLYRNYSSNTKDHTIAINVIEKQFLGLSASQINTFKNVSAILGIPSILLFILNFVLNGKKETSSGSRAKRSKKKN